MRILGGILGCVLIVGFGSQAVGGERFAPTSGCSTCSGSANKGHSAVACSACSTSSYGQLKPGCGPLTDWRYQNIWDGYCEERASRSPTPIEDFVHCFRSHVDQIKARFHGISRQVPTYGSPSMGYQVISDQPISTGCVDGNCGGGATPYRSTGPIETLDEGTLPEPVEAPQTPIEPVEAPQIPIEPVEALPMPVPPSSSAMLW